MYRRIAAVIGLEVYALTLALWQFSVGVRTDEAKYLLNIPYPHPPLARGVFSMLDGWQYQELFWRIVLATLLVQAAWLIVDCVRGSSRWVTISAAATWLLSAAVLSQGGTIMLAPLTSIQGLVFVWLALRASDSRGYAGIITLFWLMSLFTAYQAVLFGPLVWMALGRTGVSLSRRMVLIGIPVGLLGLYTLTNPLAAASMLSHAGNGADPLLIDRLTGFLRLGAIGGGIVGSVAGTVGLLVRPRFGPLMSFVLVSAYILLSPADYYAVLFTPLFAAGVIFLVQMSRRIALPLACLMPIGLLVCASMVVAWPQRSTVALTMKAIDATDGTGYVLISGTFGHDWQYASTTPVLRYDASRLDGARAVVCLISCTEMREQPQWVQLLNVPIETWIKQ